MGALILADYADLPRVSDSVLVHCAEPADMGAVAAQGEAHVAATSALAGLLAERADHLVYASSAAVYGDASPHARREDEPVAAGGLYARGKLAAEAAVLSRGGAAIRLANLYGPGMSPRNVLSDILAQIPGNRPVSVRDDAAIRDFLHVCDAATAMLALATARLPGLFNGGTGIGTAIGDLARLALACAGQPQRGVQAASRREPASTLVVDPAKLGTATGWGPAIALREGVAALIRSRP